MKSVLAISVVFSLLVAIASARPEGNSIAGVVTDVVGKPVAGAEVRAERTDITGRSAVVTTDSKGRYVLEHLPLGSFKLTTSVGKTARSVASVKTRSETAVRVDFVLKDPFADRQRRDQSIMTRMEGQDMRRMQMDQPFGH
ncbi:MAG: carboxypeptidase-like regulatory domain-containing protein [Chthoniobacterales bacterium]